MSVTLDLKFPINRDTIRRGHQGVTYSTAANEGSKVAAIEEHPSGWRIVVDNQVSYVVPHAHVEGVEIRPDRYAGDDVPDEKLPAFASKVDGGFKCADCGKVCPTLHGLKTHHGSHGRE
jgi:hypothetical protein